MAVLQRKMPPGVVASTFKATEEVDLKVMKHFGLDDVEDLIPVLGVCHLHWPWRNIQPAGLHDVRIEDGIAFDIWGVGRKEISYGGGSYSEIAYSPLAGAATVADVENCDWPTVEQLDFSGIAVECEKYAGHVQIDVRLRRHLLASPARREREQLPVGRVRGKMDSGRGLRR